MIRQLPTHSCRSKQRPCQLSHQDNFKLNSASRAFVSQRELIASVSLTGQFLLLWFILKLCSSINCVVAACMCVSVCTQLHADEEKKGFLSHYPEGDNEMCNKKPVASRYLHLKGLFHGRGEGGRVKRVVLCEFMCRYLRARWWCEEGTKMSTLVKKKKDTKIVKCL